MASATGAAHVSGVHEIVAQKVKVAFVGPAGGPFVEFVEPMEDNSSLRSMMRKGIRFYHTGYLCNSISALQAELDAAGWRIVGRFQSEAFGGSTCAFFADQDGMLIELIEQ
jgi:hypothetical protein